MTLDTSGLADYAPYVVFTVTTHEGGAFAHVRTGGVVLRDSAGTSLASFDFVPSPSHTGMAMLVAP
jgi:stress response protein SCP2